MGIVASRRNHFFGGLRQTQMGRSYCSALTPKIWISLRFPRRRSVPNCNFFQSNSVCTANGPAGNFREHLSLRNVMIYGLGTTTKTLVWGIPALAASFFAAASSVVQPSIKCPSSPRLYPPICRVWVMDILAMGGLGLALVTSWLMVSPGGIMGHARSENEVTSRREKQRRSTPPISSPSPRAKKKKFGCLEDLNGSGSYT